MLLGNYFSVANDLKTYWVGFEPGKTTSRFRKVLLSQNGISFLVFSSIGTAKTVSFV